MDARGSSLEGLAPSLTNAAGPLRLCPCRTPRSAVGGPGAEKPRRERPEATMIMTDPIADMLTRLRNANSAYHDTVAMPFSKLKSHIAEILEAEGYISSWSVED